MKNKEITLCVYSGRDGYFRMYEDAGDGYGYEDGDYCITDISWQEKDRKLTWKSSGNLQYRESKIGYKIVE